MGNSAFEISAALIWMQGWVSRAIHATYRQHLSCLFYLSQRLNSSHLTLRDRERQRGRKCCPQMPHEERTDAGRKERWK